MTNGGNVSKEELRFEPRWDTPPDLSALPEMTLEVRTGGFKIDPAVQEQLDRIEALLKLLLARQADERLSRLPVPTTGAGGGMPMQGGQQQAAGQR